MRILSFYQREFKLNLNVLFTSAYALEPPSRKLLSRGRFQAHAKYTKPTKEHTLRLCCHPDGHASLQCMISVDFV